MESTSTVGHTDRLSTLPVELLEWIFELAYKGAGTTTGPISRALLPFDRRERFKDVKVVGVKQLRRFAKLVQRKPYLASLIFTVSCITCDAGEKEPRHPQPNHLKRLFSALPNLRSLHLNERCDDLLEFILSRSAYGILPSTCHTLTVTPVYCGGWDFSSLNGSPSLQTITINLRHCEDDYDLDGLKDCDDRIRYITSLTVEGSYLDYRPLRDLIRAFTSIATLILDSQADEPEFALLLDSITAPLTSLSLLTISAFDDYSAPCDHLFPQLHHIASLTLGEGIFGHTTLFSNLRRLPSLTFLAFKLGAIVDVKELLDLVHGPTRHLPLQQLVLDMLNVGKRGWRIQEDGGGDLHAGHEAEKKHVGPGWVVPEFSDPNDRFSTSEVEQLVRIGKENGVKMSGTAVEGIEVYRDWRKEAVECLLVHGSELGDHDELEEFVGQEEAEKVLRESGQAVVEEAS